jgi:glycosyltransferase involved in cell wall biosynthesis
MRGGGLLGMIPNAMGLPPLARSKGDGVSPDPALAAPDPLPRKDVVPGFSLHNQSSAVPIKGLISIVIPCYKGEKYLALAIESCLKQSYRAIEVIVVDDASPDRCGEIADRYAKLDSRVRVVRCIRNGGVARAFNRGFCEARGEYFSRIAQDDIFEPDAMELMHRHLESRPEAGLVYSDMFLIDHSGRIIGTRVTESPEGALINGDKIGLCVMWRREAWSRVGQFDPEYDSAEDFEYWVRLARQFPLTRYPGKPLFYFRMHENMGSRQFDAKQSMLEKRIIASQCSSPLKVRRLLGEGHFEAAYSHRERRQYRLAFCHLMKAMVYWPFEIKNYRCLGGLLVQRAI